jgi:hypothetical protein
MKAATFLCGNEIQSSDSLPIKNHGNAGPKCQSGPYYKSERRLTHYAQAVGDRPVCSPFVNSLAVKETDAKLWRGTGERLRTIGQKSINRGHIRSDFACHRNAP